MKTNITIALLLIVSGLYGQQQKMKINAKAPYLNIPIQESAAMDAMRFYDSGKLVREINIRVAAFQGKRNIYLLP